MVKTVQRAQVSSLGRFRSTRGVISTPSRSASGYRSVSIHGKSHFLHRLIAFAFELPREPGQTSVDHKNNVPGDDWLTNLRFASPSEQIRHSYATNATRKSSAAKTSKPVRGRRVGATEWTDYPSVMEAARELELNPGGVSRCCARKLNHTGGFEFELAAPVEPEMLPGEEWRKVEGTTAEVSSLGRFCSTQGVKSTPSPRASGYVQVQIHGKSHYLHRLIAIAFELPREPGQTTVDHKDNDRSNNKLSNLRWASPSEQIRHSYATNATRKSNAAKQSKPVRGRRMGATEWTDYSSVNEAARELELIPAGVSNCCARKVTHTGGFEFEFAAPVEPELLPGEEWRDVVLD